MITGLMVLDCEDNLVFTPNPCMVHRVLGHVELLEELAERGVILFGKSSYKYLYGRRDQFVNNDKTEIYVGADLNEIKKLHPFQHIIVVGNRTILQNIDHLDQLMIVKYKSRGIKPHDSKFCLPLPPASSVCKLINYDILTYRFNK